MNEINIKSMKRNNNLSNFFCKWCIFLLSISFHQVTSAQTFVSKAYSAGIFIFCGKEIPKNFTYLIEKQSDDGKWTSVAEMNAPASFAECKARMMLLPSSIANVTQIQPSEIEFVWKRINKQNSSLDSLYAYGTDPRYQYMAGSGWFDEEVKNAGTYKYRVSKSKNKNDHSSPFEIIVVYPSQKLNAKVIPLRYKLNLSDISISYDISINKNVVGLKLFRGIYLQNNFKEIFPEEMFTSEKGKMVVHITDKDVTTGVTYSYFTLPYDGLGNLGMPSDTVNIYYVKKPADIGMVTDITVTPDTEKAGNLIQWKYRKSAYVNLVEIFRSTSYNGTYKKIASLSATQTEYFDGFDIQPAVTYFYYIVINNGMGNSLPSARFPAILKGNKQNIIPPQDLRVEKKGNVVTLKFRRVGNNIRGYYIYRADGYDAELKQLPTMLLSTDQDLVYNDTLPASVNPSIYSYAAVSVNTSYNISPMSNRVNISYSGGRLPVPSKLNGKYLNNKIMLVWNDASSLNNEITGYQIFRKAIYNNKEEMPEHEIATVGFSKNSYEDVDILPGRDYTYKVRCITSDSLDVSSFSLPFTIFSPADAIMPVSDFSAISIENKILLRWTLPLVENIKSLQIFRAPENEKETLIKTLPSTSENFVDTTAQKGVMYYYFITIKYKNGLESKSSDAISAKWN